RFAQQHGVKPSGDAEEVTNGVGAKPAVGAPVKFGGRNAVIAGEKILHRIGYRRPRICRNAIKLAAIARGKHHRFFENSSLAEFSRSLQRLLGSERHALAKLHRSRAMVAT